MPVATYFIDPRLLFGRLGKVELIHDKKVSLWVLGEQLNVAPYAEVLGGLLPQPVALVHAWVGGDCADDFWVHI